MDTGGGQRPKRLKEKQWKRADGTESEGREIKLHTRGETEEKTKQRMTEDKQK